MLRAIFTTLMSVALAASSLSYAEVIDESWRQVYEFQSKMAAQGSSSAQFKLGEMYQHGRGVEKNYDTAIDWYSKAKSNGHAEAAERIAMIQQAIQDNKQASQKEKAEAKRKAEEELARQQEVEKKRAAAAEARRKEEEERKKKRAVQAKKAAAEEKSKQANLSDEERARKIKEAQERAKAIAEQNRIKQQQQAEAALKEYRQAVVAEKPAKSEPQSKTPQKYIDPFD